MNRDTFTARWDKVQGDVKREWSKLTDEDLAQTKGNVDELVSLVQQKYDYTKDQAQQKVTRFMDSHNSKAVQVARRLPTDVYHEVRRHPWAAVATALGVGIAVGFLAKRSAASAAETPVQ